MPTPRTTCPKWNYLSNEKVIALELSSRPGAGVGERVHGAGTGRLDSRAERLGVFSALSHGNHVHPFAVFSRLAGKPSSDSGIIWTGSGKWFTLRAASLTRRRLETFP